MSKRFPLLAILFVSLLPAAGFAQTPAASATATPFPSQDEPPEGTPDATPTPAGIPGLGYDDEIHVPGEPTPTPVPGFTPPPDWEERDHEFIAKKDDEWDPKKVFPGNYYSLPVTMDIGWRPCVRGGCKTAPDGNIYKSSGQISLFAGYAFQPRADVQSPFMAGGLEWIVSETDPEGKTHSRSQFRPTWRFGWNFTAAAFYASTGLILPDQERTKIGYHVGAGVSSIAILALAACSAEAIPSVLEVGWDFLEDPATHKMEDEFVLKVGWGF